jgi:hypothetical protein
MRHRTDTGGDVIGRCGCQAPVGSTEDDAVVSVPVSPKGSLVQVALTAEIATVVLPPVDAGSLTVASRPAGPGQSPPRLSGAGFRC